MLQPLSNGSQLIEGMLSLAQPIARIAVRLLIEVNPLHHFFGRQVSALGADVDVDRLWLGIGLAGDLNSADEIPRLVLAMQLSCHLVIPLENRMQRGVVWSSVIYNERGCEFAVLIGDPGQLLASDLSIDTTDAGAGAE